MADVTASFPTRSQLAPSATDRCHRNNNPNLPVWNPQFDEFTPLIPEGVNPSIIRRNFERINLGNKMVKGLFRPGNTRAIYTSQVNVGPDQYNNYGQINFRGGDFYFQTTNNTINISSITKTAYAVVQSTLEVGLTATAKIIKTDGTLESGTVTITDLTQSNFALAGEAVPIGFDADRSKWIVIGSHGLTRYGKVITSALAANGGTGDVRLYRNGAVLSGNVDIDSRNHFGSPIQVGQYVWIEHVPNDGTADSNGLYSGRWTVSSVEEIATWLDLSLTGTLATSDATVPSFSIDGYRDGPSPGTAPTTIKNKPAQTNYVFQGTSGQKGSAKFNKTDNTWMLMGLEC